MSLYTRTDSPFWWMMLEGTGRRRENTGVRCDATAPELRERLRLEAESIYHARMVQLARQRVGLPVVSDTTFDKYATWYEKHHTAKHLGRIREGQILKRLRAHFGRMALADIRSKAWAEYETARLAEKVKPNTIGRELAVMKTVLETAVGEHVELNPLGAVVRKTAKLPPKRTITTDEEKRLLEEFLDDELRDLYLVGVGTLLRQHNLITLQRKHYQTDRLSITTKTGPHQVPLTGPTMLQTRAAMVLRRRLPKTHDGYFFPKWQARFAAMTEEGEGHPRAWFLKVVRRAAKRADIPWGLEAGGVVWHTMTRASGATRMMRDFGVDLRTVQVIGGWRSLDQMSEYLGVDLAAAGQAPVATGLKTRRKAAGSVHRA